MLLFQFIMAIVLLIESRPIFINIMIFIHYGKSVIKGQQCVTVM